MEWKFLVGVKVRTLLTNKAADGFTFIRVLYSEIYNYKKLHLGNHSNVVY